MKRKILFKSLIDLLFFMLCLGSLGILLIIPYGNININQADLRLEEWSFLNWSVFLVTVISYFSFLIAVYQLRKVALSMLKSNYISNDAANRLKKSGNFFIFSSIGYFISTLTVFISKLYGGNIQFIYDSDSIVPLFVCIIGVFFIIQSDVIIAAKKNKDENDLTV